MFRRRPYAEYFSTRDEAEWFIREWYAKDRKPPAYFGKIFNNGFGTREK